MHSTFNKTHKKEKILKCLIDNPLAKYYRNEMTNTSHHLRTPPPLQKAPNPLLTPIDH